MYSRLLHRNVYRRVQLKYVSDLKKVNFLLLESDLEEKYAKGGGPGGQKINKCVNKVGDDNSTYPCG